MNIFSDKVFCDAFFTAYFTKQEVTTSLFALGGKPWKLPFTSSGKPIVESTFIDFYEPYEPKSATCQSSVRRVCYLPRACHGIVTATDWFDQKLDQIYEPSPTISLE